MTEHAVRKVAESDCDLGEGPVWLPEASALLFTDIIGRRMLRWSPTEGLRSVQIGARVGCFAPLDPAGAKILAAVEQGLEEIELDFAAGTATSAPVANGAEVDDDQIMNDGKVDPAGRFIVGSKALNEADPVASLMLFDGASAKTLRDNIVISNGPAFSPDGKRIYFADSPKREIYVAAYDLETGEIGATSRFAELTGDSGYPDGMAVDAEGGLWNAHWDGARVTRYLPDGAVDRVIATPCQRPTSIAFGGADHKTMFITSAKRGTDTMEPLTMSGAGDLYAVDVDIPGATLPPLNLKAC
ncbi:MAG: SMP-30/gluconolactonase/LRE family protein [Neomegalonema sp.]|nr:SMP-30/gluconolactonase/LRE family protein [Neomegalonema sp.]